MILKKIFIGLLCMGISLQCASCQEDYEAPRPKPKPEQPEPPEPPEPPVSEYDVFLLIGQSNMAGRGVLIAGDNAPMDGVYLLTESGATEVASAPLNKYSSIRKDLSLQGMNPGYSFAKKIYATTARKVLLVVNARGGTSISEWAKGKDYYKEAVRRALQAKEYGNLVAILWHQGESDSGSPSTYMSKLSAMVSSLRTDLGAPSVPFIAGEIAWWHSNETKFNPIIRDIKNKIPNSDYISAVGTGQLIDSSDPHFNRDGQILIGERYADKVLQMCYGK